MAPQKNIITTVLAFILLLISPFYVPAQTAPDSGKQAKIKREAYPVPRETPDMLFYLQRSLDMNSVIYEANYAGSNRSRLDTEQPVDIYWLINDEAGTTKSLSKVQKLGYGVKPEDTDGDIVQIHLAAYRQMHIQLKPSPKEARYRAHVSLDGKDVILKKVYVNIDGGTKLKPNVTFIELTGTNAQNGNKVVHRIKP